MPQSLSAKPESFFTCITAVFFISHHMNPLVRVHVPFVLIFIITKITIEPVSTSVLSHMAIQVPHIFETSLAVLLHAF